jgi:glycosyltransferase involved in cell wall biosynthesis
MIDCTVVVPTYLRAELLGRCLSALVRQDMPPASYEIIVADDAASEVTREEIARLHARGQPVRYVAVGEGHYGPAAARNMGWQAGVGWLIAFTDDDTVPAPDWLRAAVARFACAHEGGLDLDAAWGRIVVPLPERPTDYERDAAGLERAGFVTANCFVRRDVLAALGGFDESFTSAWREDSDLYFRLLDDRRRVEPIESSVVLHPVRPARWGVSVAQQRKSSFDALLYRKHPALFEQHVRPARPALYFAIVSSLVIAILGAIGNSAALGWLGLATWALLTLLFAARRLRGTSRAPRHLAEMLVTSAVIPPVALFWRARGAVRHRALFW